MNVMEIAALQANLTQKQAELEHQIKVLEAQKKALVINWYGIPGQGVDTDDFELPRGTKVLCTGISQDGNYICIGYEWQFFNAYFPNPLKD